MIRLLPAPAPTRADEMSTDETRADLRAGSGHRLTSGSLTYRRCASSSSGEPGGSM